jgi:hypothetical protein
MRTGAANALNLEGEGDMLKYGVVSVFVEMLDKFERVFRVAVVTD